MDFTFCSGWILLLLVPCTLCDLKLLPQYALVPDDVGFETQCKDRYFSVSVKMPPPGSQLKFYAVDASGAYPITAQYGEFCGYTVQVVPDRVVLRASYFSCHTDNLNDEAFSFKFKLIVVDRNGGEASAVIGKTCTLSLPWPPREVLCEENYMEVSVSRDLSCPYAGNPEDLAATLSVGSAVSAWQVMFEKEGQHSEVMSAEKAAALGYFLMPTAGRIVFRTAFGRPHTTIKMANGVAIHELHSVVLFRQMVTVMKIDLDIACVLTEGSSIGTGIQWEIPTKIPLFIKSEVEDRFTSFGVTSQPLDKQAIINRGHTMAGSTGTVGTGLPYVSSEDFKKEFVENQHYRQSSFMDPGAKVVATHPMALNLLTVNKTVPEEHAFSVYLGNVPLDMVLEAVELNGNYLHVTAAIQSGYIREIPYSNGTHAYSIKVQFEDPVVEMMYFTEGVFQYSLSIKYILKLMPQEKPHYHSVSVVAYIHDIFPPVFGGQCEVNGISFKLDHNKLDYMWEFTIGPYTLTQQLADSRGYIIANNSQSLIVRAPLFTTGYVYENITLQQFFGTFEILTRHGKTLEVAKSSARRCLFKTTELLVCSPDGVMTVVSDITKSVPGADPARTTLLDMNCKPREFDETRVLFSFGLNTCGTRVKIDNQFIMYENEILFYMSYSSKNRPVITRDAPYKITVRCMYSVHGTSRLFVKRKFKAETPAATAPVDHKAKATMKVHRVKPELGRNFHPTKPRVTKKPASALMAPAMFVPN